MQFAGACGKLVRNDLNSKEPDMTDPMTIHHTDADTSVA